MSYDYATEGNTITANNDYTFYDPTTASTIYILESIDAAAASLQLGVDKDETQFIEIGSSDITTTIYGAVNMTHALNVSSLSVNNGFSVAGQTTLANVSVNNLTVTGLNVTGSNIDIGKNQTNGGTVVMGSTTVGTSTTINGGVIKQTIPVLTNSVFGSGTVSNILGNADNTTSISTTFNRKNTVVNSPNAIDCYQLTIPANYSAGYFELIIGGTNYFTNAYSYKGFFGILANRIDQNEVIISPVSSLFSIGYYTPVITITRPLGSSIVTISVNTYNPAIVTSPPAFQNQNFITTLIAYPTIINDGILNDFAVTAI